MRTLTVDEAVQAATQRLRSSLAASGLDLAVAVYYGEPGFAGMTFTDLGQNPPCEITPDDLLAVSLLDIAWHPEAVRTLLSSHGQRFGEMLAALPHETDLWDASDEALRHIDRLWDALTSVYGIGTASASKLLARKRPRLCPISDSVAIRALEVRVRAWDVLRHLLQDPAARADVEALRPAAAAGASTLRILDVAVWASHSRSAAAQWVRGRAGMAAISAL